VIVPTNVRPKTKSFGGVRGLGCLVWWISSLEGCSKDEMLERRKMESYINVRKRGMVCCDWYIQK